MKFKFRVKNLVIKFNLRDLSTSSEKLSRNLFISLFFVLVIISGAVFFQFYLNGLGLAYNDARSHLDIGRRVVEGLKPGLAQLGSVWLPLPHILMIPLIWNDFMWHSGLAGAWVSMASFVVTALLIYKFLEELKVSVIGRLVGVLIFISNINVLYLQSTAMSELLLLMTMTLGCYEIVIWHRDGKMYNLIKAAFWIMLATLTRYDGWFLLFCASILVFVHFLKLKGYKAAEGVIILFCTLAGLGIILWLLWNLLIFKDPLYFAFGPFSAYSQQSQLLEAGELPTKGNLLLSAKFYLYALVFNSGAFSVLLGIVGFVVLSLDKSFSSHVRRSLWLLLAPLGFNILALYLGHSVLFIQGLSGDTWFNVRYGVMLMPSISIFIGYFIHRFREYRIPVIVLLLCLTLFSYLSRDSVTIEDALVGSSQKNVSEVSSWLKNNAHEKEGFVLISAASHDAIIFSSGLPMKKFIHEGTGLYWESATSIPDRWARWIIMRTYDDKDLVYRLTKDSPGMEKYELVEKYPFADIYQIKSDYLDELNVTASLGRLK